MVLPNGFWIQLKRLYEKEDKTTDVFDVEKPILEKVLTKIENEHLKDIYEYIEPLGRGGAGVVIRVRDIRLNLDRALKIPRPKEYKLLESVRNEAIYLNKIRHENIIGVYNLGEVELEDFPPYPFFIMDYVENAQDLRKKINFLLEEDIEGKQIKEITKWIANKFYRIAKAINFLHSNEIIHFDIKPSNILVDKNDKPILSDLGFAKKKTNDEKPVVVGFTYNYAHEELSSRYQHMSSENRVRHELAPKDFKNIFDIYAFGKSLLEILALLDSKFPDKVIYDYTFVYLHLAACRMLDGKNNSASHTKTLRDKQLKSGEYLTIYKETWLELDSSDFEEIKYESIKDICKDFKKLITDENFLESIIELNSFHPKRIQSSSGIPAPFTQRVRYIIEHPVFSRLKYVPQLGMLDHVYPTATHNRFEHSLGVFRNCCLYVQSLINDPYNPLFKQLINEEDVKCVLLASLMHDLGQYPLAHEIEEVTKKFRHEKITLEFLDNPTKDKFGHTLKEIIENEWGWGVNLFKLKNIMKNEKNKQTTFGRQQSLKNKMLSSLIDGPIDVDKLDYLLRDSQNCYLKYGELIDVDRLLRNLTIIINKDENGNNILAVGTYEKGQIASESLTFARYLLYQSLYWHHTSRAIRVMLREAVIPALANSAFDAGFNKLLGIKRKPGTITVDDMLKFIEKMTDEDGKKIIDMIRNRNYYKRMFTIHSESPTERGKKEFLDEFRQSMKNPQFQDNLQKLIASRFEDYIRITDNPKVSLLSPDKNDKTVEMLSKPKMILCDCPTPIYGTKDNLRCIPEPQRLQKNYFLRSNTGERVSEVWAQVFYSLMNIAAKGRIFCHPEVRDSLMAAIGPEGIKESLKSNMDV